MRLLFILPPSGMPEEAPPTIAGGAQTIAGFPLLRMASSGIYYRNGMGINREKGHLNKQGWVWVMNLRVMVFCGIIFMPDPFRLG